MEGGGGQRGCPAINCGNLCGAISATSLLDEYLLLKRQPFLAALENQNHGGDRAGVGNDPGFCLDALFNCSLATRIDLTESPMGKALIRLYGEKAVRIEPR